MAININYDILENRIKQGGAAAAATFAMTAVTSYRMGHEKGLILHPSSVVKFSAIVAGVAGVIWAMMPKAKESPSETVEEAKEQLYPALKIAINRVLNNEEMFRTEVKDGYSTFGNSYGYRESRLDRLERRYPSISSQTGFDDDFLDRDSPSEDDFFDEEDFERLLMEELEEDPFYEGPSSLFDKR